MLFKTFTHLDPDHRPHGLRAIVRWGIVQKLSGERRIEPPGPGAPRVEPDLERLHRPAPAPRFTWIGHASFLLSLGGRNVLIDPVFPRRRLGLFVRRYVPPGLTADQLPPIDLLLITHSHPDHLDAPSIRKLARETPVVAPTGLGRWFRRRGFGRVEELEWWQASRRGPLKVTFAPARHWSRRGLLDTNTSLWGGFVIEAGDTAVYHAGDSGYCGAFREVGRRFPGLAAAMMPIGAYSPAWFMEPNHLSPEQAGRAFLDTGARHLLPMHWGTFQLADEPLAEPAERLRAWWAKTAPEDRELHVLAVGETLDLPQ